MARAGSVENSRRDARAAAVENRATPELGARLRDTLQPSRPMATLNLTAPDASFADVSRGLVAAGDVLRASGLSAEFVEAGRVTVMAHHAGRQALADGSWHWRAAMVFAEAEEAAFTACYGARARVEGCRLLIVRNDGL